MFKKILIANRGEIACRVIRTAKRLNITTVAVYSAADQDALHVKLADEAYCIGPAPTSESYLRGDIILEVAKKTGAQAIHPGYGFLSENAHFAESCVAAGIVFIGPQAAAIRAMGEKNTAKQLMQAAKVPVVPGYHQPAQDEQTLEQAASDIGYPILIKAVAGGGGKGMRVVTQPGDFLSALTAARLEAKASFGDDKVILERYLESARHVEVQVFADTHQHAVYLFERDCSVQRRHQKIIEEAPAPGMTPALRQAMGTAAVNAAKAIDYHGAGTIEFLLTTTGDFYFMEMNTRLQVEHPITEKITGQDLVEWQLRVADGEPLPITEQSQLTLAGHAFEARIYAEDPQKDFMPSIGTLSHLKFPAENDHVRVDTGVTAGDNISVYYDPLIAKLITWDHDRDTALARLQAALADCQVIGVTTNIPLLQAIATNPAFASAQLDTRFIERHHDRLWAMPKIAQNIVVLAALGIFKQQQSQYQLQSANLDSPSPWFAHQGWRLNLPAQQLLQLRTGQQVFNVNLQLNQDQVTAATVDGQQYAIEELAWQVPEVSLRLNQQKLAGSVITYKNELHVFAGGQHIIFNTDHDSAVQKEASDRQRVIAPMPGALTKIFVQPGQHVQKGAPLLSVEAMKMQHTLYAVADGTVKDVFYQVGDLIEEGTELLAWEI